MRPGEVKAVTNGLMGEACLPREVIVLTCPALLPRAISESTALWQPQTESMSMASATTVGHEDDWGQGSTSGQAGA